mgnify:FL=1
MAKITFEEYMKSTKQLTEKSVVLENMIHTLESSNVSDIDWVKDIKHTLMSSKEEIETSLRKVAKEFVG